MLPSEEVMILTDRFASAVKLPSGKTEYIFPDSKLKKFGLRVRAGGTKTWIVQYRFGTRQPRITIGSIEQLTAVKAREKAGEILAKVRLGIDPQTERRGAIEKANDRFEDLGQRYLKYQEKELRPGSYDQVKRHVLKYWAPFNERSILSITRKDVGRRLKEIAETSGVVTANRARATLSAMFTWAMKEDDFDIEVNPVIATNKAGSEAPRKRKLSNAEIVEVWRACDREDDFCTIVKLLLLTGQRREEVGGLMDRELDFGERLWDLPAERAKNNLEHWVPLADSAIALLSLHRRRPNRIPGPDRVAMVFGETENRPFSGWSRAKRALDDRIAEARKQAGLTDPFPPWVIHDLRRTVATGMAGLKTLPHVVEAVLNHRSGSKAGVAGTYNLEEYLPEKRQALDIWAAHIEGLLADKPLNVVQLRG
jgi:integrase